jgi:hypothetical protein
MINDQAPAEALFMSLVRRWCTLEEPSLLKEVVGKNFRRLDSYYGLNDILRNIPIHFEHDQNWITGDLLIAAGEIEVPKDLDGLIAAGTMLAIALILNENYVDFLYRLEYGGEERKMKPGWAMAFYLAAKNVEEEHIRLRAKHAKTTQKYSEMMYRHR